MKKGDVVRSLAGKDSGTLLAVLAADPEGILVVDGKHRPANRPKRKNPRHLTPVGCRIEESAMATNRALRKALRELSGNP